MKKIEVAVINQFGDTPSSMMLFLAKLTQRGHSIKNLQDLLILQDTCKVPQNAEVIKSIAALPHGTIKRFTPVTIAIVGASRRFLAQARTHQVGMTFVSASLQYSDYTDAADFVVPYELTEFDKKSNDGEAGRAVPLYLNSCKHSMEVYKTMTDRGINNDTAGYAAPQGLRNILIIQGNHEAWMHFIKLRGCNRNTVETQYVTTLIWDVLLKSVDGPEMFAYAGPDCAYGKCKEGRFCCGEQVCTEEVMEMSQKGYTIPEAIIRTKWPLLRENT